MENIEAVTAAADHDLKFKIYNSYLLGLLLLSHWLLLLLLLDQVASYDVVT